MNNARQILFQFSGPTVAASPLEAKLKALLFLHDKFMDIPLNKGFIHLYTDFMMLHRAFCQEKAGNFIDSYPFDNREWRGLINNKKARLSYLPRDHLKGVDTLAK